MRRITLDHRQLRDLVRFTDPFIHSIEKEEEILEYYRAGQLRPPSLMEHDGEYLIFNGNHRVLVAINNRLEIPCNILETLDDVRQTQTDEGDQYRDISMVSPLTFHGLIEDLLQSAEEYRHVDPGRYSFHDM